MRIKIIIRIGGTADVIFISGRFLFCVIIESVYAGWLAADKVRDVGVAVTEFINDIKHETP